MFVSDVDVCRMHVENGWEILLQHTGPCVKITPKQASCRKAGSLYSIKPRLMLVSSRPKDAALRTCFSPCFDAQRQGSSRRTWVSTARANAGASTAT